MPVCAAMSKDEMGGKSGALRGDSETCCGATVDSTVLRGTGNGWHRGAADSAERRGGAGRYAQRRERHYGRSR